LLLLYGSNLTLELAIAILLAALVAMTIHEFAHNYVGWKMGDPTPARQGRLTLNPLVHINPIGFLMFALIGFGILGSAPINAYNMPRENRRYRWLAAVAAGPFSNLLLAIALAIIIRIAGIDRPTSLRDIVPLIFYTMIQFNALLFVFNLIPLFPIDGWHIVYALLPPDLAQQWERHKMTTQYIFFGLLLLSFVRLPGIPDLFGLIIGQPLNFIMNLLLPR
jgi:Zn-dependent protease